MVIESRDTFMKENLNVCVKYSISVKDLKKWQVENGEYKTQPAEQSHNKKLVCYNENALRKSHERHCLFNMNLIDEKKSINSFQFAMCESLSELTKFNGYVDEKLIDVLKTSNSQKSSNKVSDNWLNKARVSEVDTRESAESVNASKQLSPTLNFSAENKAMINVLGTQSEISIISIYSIYDSLRNQIVIRDNLSISIPDINYIESEQSEGKLPILKTLNNHGDIISMGPTSTGNAPSENGNDSTININETMEVDLSTNNDTTTFLLYENIMRAAVSVTIYFVIILSIMNGIIKARALLN